MNLGAARDRVHRMVGQNPASPEFFPNAMVDRHISDAQEQIVRETGCLEIRVAVTTSANEQTYTLPDVAARAFRVAYDGYALLPEIGAHMDKIDTNWEQRVGTPERWLSSRLGTGKLRIYPAPSIDGSATQFDQSTGEVAAISGDETYVFNSSLGGVAAIESNDTNYVFNQSTGIVAKIEFLGDDIEVWAKKRPNTLEDANDELEVPVHSQLAVCFLAASTLLESDGEGRNPDLAILYRLIADDMTERLLEIVNNRLPERVKQVGRTNAIERSGLWRDRSIPYTGIAGAS